MISLPRSHRIIITVLCLPILLVACTHQSEVEMTPEQSRKVFITEAKAIIQAVFPDADPLVVVEGKDGPCGGPVGTEHTSVKSLINVHGTTTKNDDLDPDEIFHKVVEALRERGWTINYTRNRVAGAERKGVGGIGAGVGGSPLGININGYTECVKNPDQ